MILFEAAVLQKAHLSGLFLEIPWPATAKFPGTNFSRHSVPIGAGLFQCLFDSRIINAPLAEVEADTHGAFALVDTGLHEALGETSIILKALIRQSPHSLLRHSRIEAFVDQFLRKLNLPVFATREKVHGFLARLEDGRKAIFPRFREKIADFFMQGLQCYASFATAFTSSAALSAGATVFGNSLALILPSISSAISALLLRNSRTFSLPCPMRSSP